MQAIFFRLFLLFIVLSLSLSLFLRLLIQFQFFSRARRVFLFFDLGAVGFCKKNIFCQELQAHARRSDFFFSPFTFLYWHFYHYILFDTSVFVLEMPHAQASGLGLKKLGPKQLELGKRVRICFQVESFLSSSFLKPELFNPKLYQAQEKLGLVHL
jgi:hypothetical protein